MGNFMKPLLYANYLTYKTSPGPQQDVFFNPSTATIAEEHSGGYHWERFYQLEHDPELGPTIRVFVDHKVRRAIVAVLGECIDQVFPICRAYLKMGQNGQL